MRRLILLLCLLATPALAQEREPEAVGNLSRDWASLVNATRHASMAIAALVEDRNRLAGQVRTLEEKLQGFEGKKCE